MLDSDGHFSHGNHVVWQCLAWVATTVIFLITGLVIADLLIVQFSTRTAGDMFSFFTILAVIYVRPRILCVSCENGSGGGVGEGLVPVPPLSS